MSIFVNIQSSTLCNTSSHTNWHCPPSHPNLAASSALHPPARCQALWLRMTKNSESQTSNHITLQSQIIQLIFLSDSNFNCQNHDFRSKPSGTRRAKVIRALASTPPLPNSKLCLGRNFRNSTEKSGQPKMKLWGWKSQHSILISPACWFSSYECKYTRWIEKNKRSNQNEEDTQWSMYVHQKGLSGISWKCQMFQDCLGELCSSFDGE